MPNIFPVKIKSSPSLGPEQQFDPLGLNRMIAIEIGKNACKATLETGALGIGTDFRSTCRLHREPPSVKDVDVSAPSTLEGTPLNVADGS